MPGSDPAFTPVPAAINVMDVLRGVGRRKLLIGGIGLMALIGGMGLVNTLKPVYSTEAQVLIQNLETPYDRVQPTDNQRADGVDDRVVASQIAVLESDDLGRRVVASLGLEDKPEFNALINGMGSVGKIKLALGFGDDPRLKTPEDRALGRYSDQLSVYQQPNSNVIVIKYSSNDPKTAADVANMLAETYVVWTRESQAKPTERAREWLAKQIADLRQKLAKSEEAVETFRAEAGLLQGATTTLGTQEISELNTQMTVAKTASSEARAKADAIRSMLQDKGSVEDSADVLASAAVQRLKEQRTEAVRRAAELSATYLSNHPKMIAAQKEIASLDRQIRSEAMKVVSSLEEQARVADARERSLRASLEQLKGQESTANVDEVKLKALEREASADRALLETLLSRYAEASTRQDETAQPGLARVIQTAGVPTSPSFPKVGPMVMLITIAGFSFAFGLAFLMELMAAAARLTARNAAEAEEPRFAPPLPAVAPAPVPPQMQAAPVPPASQTYAVPPAAVAPMPAPQMQMAPAAPAWQPPPVPTVMQHLAVLPQSINLVEAAVTATSPEVMTAARQMADWSAAVHGGTSNIRVGLTSIGGSAGDTSVASMALARTLALSGKRVIVLDLSRTGSWLETLGGVAKGAGISELVTGAADFTKVIGRDVRSPVHILRYGNDRSPAASSLLLERVESVMAALAQAYEIVVVNLGEAQQETPLLLHKCSGALLLAPPQRVFDVTSAIQALLSTGVKAAGHVLIGPPAAQSAPDFSLKSA